MERSQEEGQRKIAMRGDRRRARKMERGSRV